MAKTLRVGIVGANAERGWARESHVPAVQKLAGLEFAAVASKGQDTADAAARAFGVGKAYGDAADMFRDPDIDLVTVAVTLPAHHALVLGALEAGKHIYCEYPLGLDVAESEVLAEAARKSGVRSAIGLQTRGSPAVRRARELTASGAIGRPLGVRVYSPAIGFGAVTNPAEAYTEKPENGVTVVTIQGAHTLDLVIALLGGFSDVSALASTLHPEIRIGDGAPQKRTTFDHLLVQGRLASGAAASVEVAGGRPAGTPFRLDITGESGVLTLEGGAMRGFQAGRLRFLLNGEPQAVDEGESAGMPDFFNAVGRLPTAKLRRSDACTTCAANRKRPHTRSRARMFAVHGARPYCPISAPMPSHAEAQNADSMDRRRCWRIRCRSVLCFGLPGKRSRSAPGRAVTLPTESQPSR